MENHNHPRREIMERAIQEAKDSAALGQYALGAVVVDAEGNVLAVEHTTTLETNDATAHAELNALRAACKKLNSRYLPGCWLYTTLEPCPMCVAGAIWAKMDGVAFGATQQDAMEFGKQSKDPKFTWRQIDVPARDIIAKGNPHISLIEGFMKDECKRLFEV